MIIIVMEVNSNERENELIVLKKINLIEVWNEIVNQEVIEKVKERKKKEQLVFFNVSCYKIVQQSD